MTIIQTLGGVATLIVVVALVNTLVRSGSQGPTLIKNVGDAFVGAVKAAQGSA